MFIYEVGHKSAANILPKMQSLKRNDYIEDSSSLKTNELGKAEENWTESLTSRNISVKSTKANIKRIHPAMNVNCREGHFALKWGFFEMYPPVANNRIQTALKKTMRLRRIVFSNGGGLTNGGCTDGGFKAACLEKIKIEQSGIRIITIGMGEGVDSGLKKLSTCGK